MQLLGHDYELNAEGFEKVVIRKDGMPYAECMSRLHAVSYTHLIPPFYLWVI